MRIEEGEGLRCNLAGNEAPLESTTDLEALTKLMDLSCQVAAHAEALYATEEVQRGMKLMETADLIAEEVGVWTERCGYTIDEVTRPLWRGCCATSSVAATPRNWSRRVNGGTRNTRLAL